MKEKGIDLRYVSLDLALSFLATGVAFYLATRLLNQDSARLLSMRGALISKRVCQAQADFWQANAAKCATAYQKLTL